MKDIDREQITNSFIKMMMEMLDEVEKGVPVSELRKGLLEVKELVKNASS